MGAAAAHNGPCRAAGPDIQVVLGVGHHGLLARGARRGVNPGQVIPGDGDQAEGIGVPQVLLGGEGQLGKVIDGADILGLQAHLVEPLFVQGHMVIAALNHLHQPLGLDLPQGLPGGALNFGLIIVWHR